MNPSSSRMRYTVGGIVVLSLIILLGWFGLYEASQSSQPQPAKVQPAKSQGRHPAPLAAPADDFWSETNLTESNDLPTTNAATLYREAFALQDALTKEEKTMISNWRSNIDASVEAELCEKILPICELMHQAAMMPDCDWEIGPMTLETKLPHLMSLRSLSRSAIWSAAHCRPNDVAGATDDVLSVLQLGQRVSESALLGCLIDMALQELALSWVAENVGLSDEGNGGRLYAAFDNDAYIREPGRALEKEAEMLENFIEKMKSPAEFERALSEMFEGSPPQVDRDAWLIWARQVVAFQRDASRLAPFPSTGQLEAMQRRHEELKESGLEIGLEEFLPNYDSILRRTQSLAVKRMMVMAGLAVAQSDPDALQNHPDPATGQPFVYIETADGFELQSAYQVNDKPLTLQFK